MTFERSGIILTLSAFLAVFAGTLWHPSRLNAASDDSNHDHPQIQKKIAQLETKIEDLKSKVQEQNDRIKTLQDRTQILTELRPYIQRIQQFVTAIYGDQSGPSAQQGKQSN